MITNTNDRKKYLRVGHKIKNAFSNLLRKIVESKIARSKFIKQAKRIKISKTMKIAGPIIAIISGFTAFPVLMGIITSASAAVLAETATAGSLTIAALLASYEAYTVSEGIEGAIDLKKLQEDEEIRNAIQEIISLFRRDDLPKGNIGF